MKILVVGSGGREHAIIRKLKQSPKAEKIFCCPGNGGISADAECVAINAMDIEGVVNFSKENQIDLVVVAPDDPLAAGMVDALNAEGIMTFGPTKAAAQIEASKVFAKDLMKQHNIPTASYEVFDDPAKALSYIEQKNEYPVVIKADGLALGKGVIIAADHDEAGGFGAGLCGRQDGGSDGFLDGPQARPGRRQGPQHRRHGHRSPQPLLHPGGRPAVHGAHLPADREGDAGDGPPV